MWRRVSWLLLVVAALMLVPTPVQAHGGPLVYSGEAGPYQVEAYRIFGSSGEQRVLTYTLYLRAVGGGPVDGASVRIAVRRDEEAYGPTEAWSFGNQYEAQFNVAGTDGRWSAEVTIDGRLGPATLTHGLAPPSSAFETPAPWLVPLLAIASVWAVGRALRRRRRRSTSKARRRSTKARRRAGKRPRRRRRARA